MQVRLSGRPPVQVDGETLAPEVQLALAMLERRREPPPETLNHGRGATSAASPGRRSTPESPTPVGAVTGTFELDLGGDTRRRRAPLCPGRAGRSHPLLVYYHGGGFTYGDLETHDGRVPHPVSPRGGAHVLAIDYRLAPEHPFPAAVEDARAALRWAFRERAKGLGADSAAESAWLGTARAGTWPR